MVFGGVSGPGANFKQCLQNLSHFKAHFYLIKK